MALSKKPKRGGVSEYFAEALTVSSTSLHQVSIYDHRRLAQRAGAPPSAPQSSIYRLNVLSIVLPTCGTTNPCSAHSIARDMPRWSVF
jgi:hypothetical protein